MSSKRSNYVKNKNYNMSQNYNFRQRAANDFDTKNLTSAYVKQFFDTALLQKTKPMTEPLSNETDAIKARGRKSDEFYDAVSLEGNPYDNSKKRHKHQATEPVSKGESEAIEDIVSKYPNHEILAKYCAFGCRRTLPRYRGEFIAKHLPKMLESLNLVFPDRLADAFLVVELYKQLETEDGNIFSKNRNWGLLAREVQECCVLLKNNSWILARQRLEEIGWTESDDGGEAHCQKSDGGHDARIYQTLPYKIVFSKKDGLYQDKKLVDGLFAKSNGICIIYTPKLDDLRKNVYNRIRKSSGGPKSFRTQMEKNKHMEQLAWQYAKKINPDDLMLG